MKQEQEDSISPVWRSRPCTAGAGFYTGQVSPVPGVSILLRCTYTEDAMVSVRKVKSEMIGQKNVGRASGLLRSSSSFRFRSG